MSRLSEPQRLSASKRFSKAASLRLLRCPDDGSALKALISIAPKAIVVRKQARE